MDNKTIHILLVEDDKDHADLVCRAFESRSEEVNLKVVRTLKEARKSLKLLVPQLLIADLRLPDGEGIELLPPVTEGGSYPVMIMTSHGDEQRAVEAMKAGALDYVVKTRETLTDMPHFADGALREWEIITHRKESEKLQTLQKEVLEKIVAGESTITILNALCVQVETMVSPSVCSIMVFRESSCSLHILAAPNALEAWCSVLDGLKPGAQAGSCGTAAYTGEPVMVSDTEVDPRWAPFRDLARQFRIRGCWSIPIFSEKKKILGTFAISHPNPRASTLFHCQLLELASYMAGIIIQRREAEDRLRVSEDQFRDLYDSAPLAYFKTTPEGHILMANSKAVELFGYSKEELTDRQILELYAPTEQGQVEARDMVEQLLTGREIKGKELELQRADGSRIWGSVTIRLIFDAQGVPIERRGIIEDITLRKRVEKSIAQQKTILEMIALGQSLHDILTRLCEIIEDQSSGLVCSIHLLEGTVLRNGAAPGLPETYIRKLDGVAIGPCAGSCGTAAFRRELVIVSDIATDPLWERGRGLAISHGLRACWSTPILSSDGSVLGTFAMYYHEPRTPNSEDLKLIATSTHLAGIAIEHRKAQENLQKSEARYRVLYEDNPTIYFTVSSDGTVLSVNQFGVEQLGYTVDDLVGQPVFNIVYEEDRPKVQDQVTQCFQKSEQLNYWEFRKVRKDGSLLWMRETGRVVESSDHQPVLFIVCEDITIRKQAEDTLRAIVEGTAAVTSADFFRSLLRHLTVALGAPYAFIAECVDATNTRVRTLAFLNRDTFIENVEYALEGTPCEEVIAGKVCYHPQDVQGFFPRDTNLVTLGVQCYFGFPLRDSMDKVIGHLVIMSTQPVKFDPQTESLLRIFAARAGAELERKQVEEALLERTERYELIAAGAYDAIWDWDVPNHRVDFSPRWKELRGFASDEVSDHEEEWSANIHPDDTSRIMAAVQAHFEGKTEFFEEEYRIHCKDGSWKWILDRGLAQRNAAGHVVRMAGSESDITERKQAEEALQKSNERLRALNVQLSAAEEAERKRMARELHDQFGQTLTLLKFELAEMADGFPKNGLVPSVSPASDKLRSITALVDSTIQSVRNISSFLRPPILDDFGLIPALEWLGEDLQERTHVQCSISIDPQLTHLSLNETLTTTLFRIAQELLTNVIRHADASHMKLGFKMESNDIILDVCDNGQGIREESCSGSDSFGLRGIRERAWLLGGHFIIQGQPGKGTTATVRVPIDV